MGAVTGFRVCWWCRDPFPESELLHLEGARLVGSEPLRLPERMSEAEKADSYVCHACALSFALLRRRVDIERWKREADVAIILDAPLALAPEEMLRIERTHGRTVAERLRRMLSEHKEIG